MASSQSLFEDTPSVEVPKRQSAALRYPGSKWSLAQEIVGLFGSHYHYVEPYFGSGAVFFSKPVSPHELINDMNGLVVNFFRVLRDQTDDLLNLGVIAQELQQVLPECVKQESTGVLSVDTDNLTWYLVNAVKQLAAQNEELKARIETLEGAK